MSEYYLADLKAEERARQRQRELAPTREPKQPKQSQDMKVTLLGDFLFPTSEPQGCDPYNSTQRQVRARSLAYAARSPLNPRPGNGPASARLLCGRGAAAVARGAKFTVLIPVRKGLFRSQFRAHRVQQRQIFDAGAQVGVR